MRCFLFCFFAPNRFFLNFFFFWSLVVLQLYRHIDNNEAGDWGDDRSILLLTADVFNTWDEVGVLGAQLKGRNAALFFILQDAYRPPCTVHVSTRQTSATINYYYSLHLINKNIFVVLYLAVQETHTYTYCRFFSLTFFPAVSLMCGKIKIARFCFNSIEFFISMNMMLSFSAERIIAEYCIDWVLYSFVRL